ncbi:hypothetical protein [Actinoplanes sp. NPDC051851]|uniref:hypothetical protein n=1 Tax=Actinoplanes sp. NPDC051851 TaxID=3154753 RepID=UPI00341D0249
MNVFAETLLAAPMAPMVAWVVLMLLSLPALLLLAAPRALRSPRQAAVETVGALRRYRRELAVRRAKATEAARFADEVSVAAERADEAAQRWHDCWAQADRHVDEVWQAWQDAERELARMRVAGAFRLCASQRTTAEYADRERYLHRAVRDAVDRGDLPAATLTEVLAGRGDWDARRHPVEQELVVQQAVVAHRERVYRQAAAAERTAWHDAQLALSARGSLRHEAGRAGAQAAALRHDLPASVRHQRAASRRLVVQQAA